jgi:hypothetical protein
MVRGKGLRDSALGTRGPQQRRKTAEGADDTGTRAKKGKEFFCRPFDMRMRQKRFPRPAMTGGSG